ncbi:MAG: ABC transporter ATP-binding protein, partial [Lachnospiraceae bacterium]|nr:ABC transporter ATP-binding protein [Lachnospiraceae bacterium]
SEKVLEIRNLKVVFPNERGIIRAVEGIDLNIEKGKCTALVGESGCGKSVTSLAAMKLLENSGAVVQCDKMELCGVDILSLNDKQMQEYRGSKISMVFQDALSALNPVMTIGKQMDEIYIRHFHVKKKKAKARSIEALRLVGVPDAERRYRAYPHELSGGMRQRVLIAMAFACSPELIIADEPTTALDVTIQAQVLDVLANLQKTHNTALLLITHDFSVVAHMADEICVMYCGKIVERAPARELFQNPLHPYTKGLIASIAKMEDPKGAFVQIPDSLPNPMNKPQGCYFHPRCSEATEKCRKCMPPMRVLENGRELRCWRYDDKNAGKGDRA